MRRIMVLAGLACACMLAADAPKDKKTTLGTRYGIEVDALEYPQTQPQDTLASVLKAIDNGRFKYLLAQLADPTWVDERVHKDHAGKFDDLVNATREKFDRDKASLKDLRHFAQAGTWNVMGDDATAQVKDATERIYMRRIDNRWFLENRKQPAPEK